MSRPRLPNGGPAPPGPAPSAAQGTVRHRLVPARPATLALNLAGLVLALGTITVASVAATPRGTPASETPPTTPPAWNVGWTVDALGLLLVIAAIGTAALLAAVLLPGRRWRKHDEPDQVVERPPLSAVQRLAVTAVPLAMLGLFVVLVLVTREAGTGIGPAPAASNPVTHPGAGATLPAPAGGRPAGQPATSWLATHAMLAAVATAAVVVLIVLLAWLLVRRRPRPEAAATVAPERPDAVPVPAVEDPGRIADPRRAVVAAYARMEADLGARGLGRDPAEAPLEYLARVRPALHDAADAPTELTEAFELARFSRHQISLRLRDQAISALDRLRHQLGSRRPS